MGRPLVQIPATRLLQRLAHPMLEAQKVKAFGASGEVRDPGLLRVQSQPESAQYRRHQFAGRLGLLAGGAQDHQVIRYEAAGQQHRRADIRQPLSSCAQERALTYGGMPDEFRRRYIALHAHRTAKPNSIELHRRRETLFKTHGRVFAFLNPPSQPSVTVNATRADRRRLRRVPAVERADWIAWLGWVRSKCTTTRRCGSPCG